MPMPIIKVTSGGSSLCSSATIEAPICGEQSEDQGRAHHQLERQSGGERRQPAPQLGQPQLISDRDQGQRCQRGAELAQHELDALRVVQRLQEQRQHDRLERRKAQDLAGDRPGETSPAA